MSNAVKFSERGTVTIKGAAEGETLDLNVSDTGIGIRPEDMERLFGSFERFESHLKVKAGGTGLGLYLTKKIAEEVLGGEVYVESEIGKGSTFGLKIPCRLPGA
jgi:signal transduction histidine kinase